MKTNTKRIDHTFSTNEFGSWSLVVFNEDTSERLAGHDDAWYLTRGTALRVTRSFTTDPEVLKYLSQIVIS